MDYDPPEKQLIIMNVRMLNRIDPLRKEAKRGPDDGKGLSHESPGCLPRLQTWNRCRRKPCIRFCASSGMNMFPSCSS